MKISSKLYTASSTFLEDERPLENAYKPLNNILNGQTREDFITDQIQVNLDTSTEMLVYPSYDGSVNLFITNDKNEPIVVNSGFAKLSNNKCRIIERVGDNNTNEYKKTDLYNQIKLFTTVTKYPKIHLENVFAGGELSGGNYTLYFKYGDKDGNKTDIIGESGVISVFQGDWQNIPSIKGTLAYERTDKAIQVSLKNVDTRFTKLYVYVHWNSSDLDGNVLQSTYELVEPYDLDGSDTFTFSIYGTESKLEISKDDLNIQYNIYNTAKTQTTVQNMLFLGNLGRAYNWHSEDDLHDSLDLAELTQTGIFTTCVQEDSVGYVSEKYGAGYNDGNGGEYYNPKNIYERLGYWPDELYRFGIVYIFKDGSRSRVFNLTGGHITNIGEIIAYKEGDDSLNEFGVFRTPNVNIIQGPESLSNITDSVVKPLAFKFTFRDDILKILSNEYDVVAYYFVRQTRLPITIAQGLSIGVNRNTGVPTPLVYEDGGNHYKKNKNIGDPTCDGLEDSLHIHGNYYKTESFLAHNIENRGDGDHWGYRMILPSLKPLVLSNEHYNKVLAGVSLTTKNFKGVIPPKGSDGVGVDKFNTTISGYPISSPWNYTYSKAGPNDMCQKAALWNSYLASNLHYGLICTDAYCIPQVQSLLKGDLYLSEYIKYYNDNYQSGLRYHHRQLTNSLLFGKFNNNPVTNKYTVSYIDTASSKQTIYKQVKNPLYGKKIEDKTFEKEVPVFFPFTTMIGSALKAYECKYLYLDQSDPQMRQMFESNSSTLNDAVDFIRGNWTAFVGIVPEKATTLPALISQQGTLNVTYYGYDKETVPCTLYSIKNVNLSDKDTYKLEVQKRSVMNNAYFATSEIYNISERMVNHKVYRGDCFTCTTTTRMQWNFIDPEIALADTFSDTWTWSDKFGGIWGKPKEGDNDMINRADINSIHLGYWLTYKSLSNYNLGLRSEDKTNVTELKELGNYRSFFPARGADRTSGNKMPDSNKLNIGYSNVSSIRNNFGWKETPYENMDYTNRVAFSNMQISKAFENNFKVFQALSYQDIDSTYGDIVKFEPYGSDIFCVFEHGCGIIPINEKALLSTTTGSSIHIYGTGVIPDKIQIVSPNYGSIWHDSIIRTPNGIYGVDASAGKIWRYTGANSLTLISDMRVGRFLQEEMVIVDKQMFVGVTNIKTHYNESKGDVMFTFYNKDRVWNLCYNELLDMFTCKYTWIPLESGNIDNAFVSIPLTTSIPYSDDSNEWLNSMPHNWDNLNNQDTYHIYKHSDSTQLASPTFWYDTQHPFEFEFVVAQPTGSQKLFDNLMILSNNAEPDSLEITITGDNYDFGPNVLFPNITIKDEVKYNTTTSHDSLSDDLVYTLHQKCMNIKNWGRRVGNIEHKEDLWYATLPAITFKCNNITSQARLRGMWAKVRIKYTGKDLAIITSIITLLRLSNG